MARISVVLTTRKDWAPYHPSDDLVEVDNYLDAQPRIDRRRLIVNLCRDYQYLSRGYYCSLLAESRGQRVLPSIRTINSLGNKSLYVLDLADINATLKIRFAGDAPRQDSADSTPAAATPPTADSPKAAATSAPETGDTATGTSTGAAAGEGAKPAPPDRLTLRIYFGQTTDASLKDLARQVFDLFPCPILEVQFRRRDFWAIDSIRAVGLNRLDDAEQTEFANAFDRFSRNIWRERSTKKAYSYDMAILVDPKEALPPSDPRALKNIEKAMRNVGIDVDFITRRDFARLPEYDALFIRETTAIDNHTYRFAKRAESEGAVVVDDPTSMLRCTNKVYLANLLEVNQVPRPRTIVLNRHRPNVLETLHEQMAFPIVLKIPDGSFSRGIVKAADKAELHAHAEQFFRRSALIIAQEFYPTDFDWRIGVFNGEVLFCCQYFMTKGHWQIYKHGEGGKVTSGGFRTVPNDEAPPAVVDVALRAANLIGNGLYGVDLKQRGEEAVIVEVNDNPNIDSGVEDVALGKELYRRVALEFRRRLDLATFGGAGRGR